MTSLLNSLKVPALLLNAKGRLKPPPDWLGIILFGLVYGAMARFGLEQSSIADNVTLIWPPSGISLFVVLRFGYHWWPGIVIGDLIGNATTQAPLVAVCGIALGNVLATFAGAWLLRQRFAFSDSLPRSRDVIALLALGSACSVLSAFIGPGVLATGGVIQWSLYWSVWLQWWMGDATGVVVLTPLLLAWWRRSSQRKSARLLETVALALLTAIVGLVVFGGLNTIREGYYPASLALFPLAVWSALRFGVRGATAVTLCITVFAIWGTVKGQGPFVVSGGVDSLVRWWVFVNVISVTSLLLAASRNERLQAQEALESERDFVSTVLDTEAAIVLVLDQAGRIVRVNRALEELSGRTAMQLSGKVFLDALIAPEHQQKVAAHEEMLRLNLSNVTRYRSDLALRNGGRRQIAWSNAALRNGHGEITHHILTGIDITEQAQASADLRHARRELERRVSDRTQALATANADLQSEITERQRLEREIIHTAEHEQMRIGQELHDSLGQQLTATAFLAEVLAGKLKDRGAAEAGEVSRIGELLAEAVSHTRLLARGLAPVEMDAKGLMGALEQLAASTSTLFSISCKFRCEATVLIHDGVVAANLFRIAQEAVTNAVKHSGAERIAIALSENPQATVLTISDDGMGFLSAREGRADGMGLGTMRYRARAIGARLAVESVEGTGVTVNVAIPHSQSGHTVTTWNLSS